MATSPMPFLTPEHYLEMEGEAECKSEYIDGQMYAMAGGTPMHSLIAALLTRLLLNRLIDGPCAVFVADLLVAVAPTGPFYYPDLTILCGPMKTVESKPNVLANPTVVIEILSKATEAFDRGAKFAHYRSIGSLREYVLVSQTEPRIEVFRRSEGSGWIFSEFVGDDAVFRLHSVNCDFALRELYERAKIDAPSPQS